MIDKFLALGFRNMGQFSLIKNVLYFKRVHEEYNPAKVIWVVATDKETLYVGVTVDPINIVLKDMLKENEHRSTRNGVHLLVKEYSLNCNVYFLVGDVSAYSKQNLIEQFSPVGNKNGK